MQIEERIAARARVHARRGVHAPGVVGNARLTALTAVVLLVLLAVEGATLLSLQTFLSWHVFVGMLLVPIVGLKVASTGWRFLRYYSGHGAYVAAGPPHPLLRLLGPLVVVSTLGLFASGVGLIVVGPGHPLVLLLHQASFAVWLAAMSLHVLGHLVRVRTLASDEVRDLPKPGSWLRLGTVAAAIVAGAVLAVATVHTATPWIQAMHARA